MRFYSIFLIMGLFLMAGCATVGDQADIGNEKEKLAKAMFKVESLKKENQDLKNEISLFQKIQTLDSRKFLDVLSVLRKSLAGDVADDVDFEINDRGLVIIVSSEKLFISGSDLLSDGGKAFLDMVGLILKENFFSNYVFIEGHTDNQSLAVFEWKSDWDFSFARALNVLKYFAEKNYIDPLRLSAAGFGQYRPRQTNETKEGRKANRRIEIIVSPKDLKLTNNNS